MIGVYEHKPHQGFQKGHKTNVGNNWNAGKAIPEDTRLKISEALKGLNTWAKGRKVIGRKSPPPFTTEHRKNLAKRWSGENNPRWKGGITPINQKIRASLEFKEWRKAVFARDNYTCQSCKATGVELNADHELPFAFYPDLRFEVLNGRTLCVPCHQLTPTFANSKNPFE